MGPVELAVLGIVVLASSAVGSWAGGLQDARRGPKPVIVISIVALGGAVATIVTIGPNEGLFLPVGPETAAARFAESAYYVCGAVIGAASGALQAASRTLMAHLAERERMAEAFGLFALAGRGTAFLAPLLVAAATDLSASQRVGVVPILALLAAGLLLMGRVRAGDGAAPTNATDAVFREYRPYMDDLPGRKIDHHGHLPSARVGAESRKDILVVVIIFPTANIIRPLSVAAAAVDVK